MLLPVVQRAPVDGRVDEIGAPLQQCASYPVRHHLGWQRERLQKIFPKPSIRIQVKASTCQSSQIKSSQHKSSQVKSSQVRSSQVKASTCQACYWRSSITSMPIDPIRRHQRQSDVIKGRTEEILDHVDAHPLAPTRRALDCAGMLDGGEPRP